MFMIYNMSMIFICIEIRIYLKGKQPHAVVCGCFHLQNADSRMCMFVSARHPDSVIQVCLVAL